MFSFSKKKATYHSASSVEGDHFIEQLCEDLKVAKEYMSFTLPPEKIEFIFASLSYLICWILIKGLAKIQRIDAQGVKRMCNNVYDLQHHLTGVIPFSENSFNSVRNYYSLLNVTNPEHFLELVKNSKANYTVDEYFALIEHLKEITERKMDKEMDTLFDNIKQFLNN